MAIRTTNPLILLQNQRATPNIQPALNQLVAGIRRGPAWEERKTNRQANRLDQQQMTNQGQKMLGDRDRMRIAQGSLMASQLMPAIQQGDIEGARSTLNRFAQNADELGVDPSLATQGIQMLEQSPQQLRQYVERLDEIGRANKPVGDEIAKIRKETRGRISGRVEDLTKAASEVESNFKKIGGLVDEMKSGNRQAVAQALIALVKLGEPNSTVREGEMLAALNAESPLAALTKMTKEFERGGASDVGRAILRKIDPLNPETIDANNVLSTAEALVSASVPQLQRDFELQKELAQSNLSREGFGSIFSDRMDKVISGLGGLSFGDQSPSRRTAPGGGQARGGKPVNEMSDDELLNF